MFSPLARFARIHPLLATWILLCLFALPVLAAEHFGDITVAPQSLGVGETFHGYREFRVMLQNDSLKDAHRVTLIYPDRAYSYGNSISRMSRTVTVPPGAQAIVPLWQPPLPANGSGNYRVLVDDELAGTVALPGVLRHMTRSGYGSGVPAAILISRSLNFDEVSRAMKSDNSSFSAKMATGPPDSGGRGGMVPTAWSPDTSKPGPHWIELDYNTPIAADHVRVYDMFRLYSSGEVTLTGVSGTNLARIPFGGTTGPMGRARGTGMAREVTFPLTPEPVRTVRVDFGSTFAGSIGVDAVELAGPSGSAWASDARASSEANVRAPGYSPYGGGGPSGYSGQEPLQMIRSETSVSEWSDSWLSYSAFDAVVLNAADVRSAPPAVLTALWRYAESGGNLVLLGASAPPAPWLNPTKRRLEKGQCFDVGFGHCFVFENENASAITTADGKTVMDSVNAAARFWQSLPDESAANASFPVVENSKIPVRSTVFIMLIFVLLIGPVNLIVCSRLKRRTWLLWTIPAISLATCLVVFAYSLLREGVTPDARVEGLTVLDQANRRATSIGMEAFYCPLTPSQGLFFDFDTEATPLVEIRNNPYGRSSSGTARELDWSQAQHFERGWVAARVPAHFQVRKSETRRERLQVENANGQISVVNGLGASIRSLWLADASGHIFSGDNIAAGQRANLAASSQNSARSDASVPGIFEQASWNLAPNFVSMNASRFLRPGTYMAELETNPFLENALGARAKSSRTRSRAVVYGILEASGQTQTSER